MAEMRKSSGKRGGGWPVAYGTTIAAGSALPSYSAYGGSFVGQSGLAGGTDNLSGAQFGGGGGDAGATMGGGSGDGGGGMTAT